MYIRIILVFFTVFICTICNAQKESKKFTFKEVGWTITLPASYEVIDSTVDAAIISKGKKAIEESNDIEVDMSQTKTLISASKSQFNYFDATITAFDAHEDGDYQELNQSVKDALFTTFEDQIHNAKMDSSTSTIIIDGIIFDKFQIKIVMGENSIMNMILLSRLRNGFDFGISYLYLDEVTKQEIEHMLNTSKFEK